MPDPLATVRALSAFAPRAPCSDGERRAAEWLRAEIDGRGSEAWVEPVWIRPQWAGSLLLHTAVAALASVLSISLPAVGLGLALLAAASLALEASGRMSPLRLPFRRRATQVVVSEPEDPDAITLLLCAGYDAPHRGLIFAEGFRRLAARAPRRAPGPLGWLALSALAVAAAAGVRLTGADPLWLGIVQFVPTVVLLMAFAAAADIALSDVSPGANDPASGAAVALAIHDALGADPPAELSPALLLTGAGEGIPSLAVRAHLKREGLAPDRVVLLELGPCGTGTPVVATRHPQLREAAAAAGLPLGALRRPTAVRAARTLRLPAARLASLDDRGVTPRSRQPSDTPDAIEPAALQAALDAALELVDALDEALSLRAGQAGAPDARSRASSAK